MSRTIKLVFAAILSLGILSGVVGLGWLRLNNGRLLSVQTTSMVPAISKGDLVVVTRIPTAKLAVGDVVTFINPVNSKETITHRILQLPNQQTGGRLITKGDNNPAPDAPVDPSTVVGVAKTTAPKIGYLFDFIRQPYGLVLLVYVPALAIIFSELRRLADYYKTQQPYIAEGYRLHRRKLTIREKLALGSKLTLMLLAIGAGYGAIAYAALQSSATLTNNTISTAAVSSGVFLRRVEFHCDTDNTPELNRLPEIFIYNTNLVDQPAGNWYLRSSSGVIATFRPQTVFDSRDNYDIEPDLRDGLQYSGDYLALFDDNNILMDAISWGTDTTYLNPSLVSPSAGFTFRRISLILDTNSVADWAVSTDACN